MNEIPCFSIKENNRQQNSLGCIQINMKPAKIFASSLGTERKCLKSDLFPTSEITMFASE